jgi:hypothetical protein
MTRIDYNEKINRNKETYCLNEEIHNFHCFSNIVDRLCGLVVKSSWLQIRRPGFDSRHYQKKKVVGLERGPLSLVSTTEELLDRKVAAPV